MFKKSRKRKDLERLYETMIQLYGGCPDHLRGVLEGLSSGDIRSLQRTMNEGLGIKENMLYEFWRNYIGCYP